MLLIKLTLLALSLPVVVIGALWVLAFMVIFAHQGKPCSHARS